MRTNLKVLLVDDDPAVLSVHSRLLRRRCAVVETATHGAEALECLSDDDFDLVLCDIRMPGLDGVGVLRRAPEGTRIAFLTGYADYPKRQLLAEGAFDVLSKPARIDEVLGLVERVHAEVAGGSLSAPSPSLSDRLRRHRPAAIRAQRVRRSQSALPAASSNTPVGISSEPEA